MNPNQIAIKHKNDVTSDVTGQGYVMEYAKVNTNNLSMLEYAHGSGTMDYADILYDEQKTTHTSNTIYYINTKGDFISTYVGANSAITYTKQYDNVQSPTNFAYGTGWYASHPVAYNSLLKDKNEARSYQEAVVMQRQVEYARAVKGDIAVDMNCTSPTATVAGKGSVSMKTDDDITQGTLHISEMVTRTLRTASGQTSSAKVTPRSRELQGWHNPIIEIESNYVGDFQVQKTMKIDMSKSAPTWGEDWLPCCSGGFFDLPSRFFDKQYGSQKGIFDCTCRNTSISTFQPKWNTTLAQFPTEKYQYKP